MNKAYREALEEFAEVIQNPCPTCGKPAGKLCNTPFVWVHYSRFELMDPEKYRNQELWPM